MSWSGNCIVPKGATHEEAKKVIEQMVITGNDDCPEERKRIVTDARSAAYDLVIGGALGSLKKHAFAVNIGGHVNPKNAPRSGWSNDSINLNVYQKDVGE